MKEERLMLRWQSARKIMKKKKVWWLSNYQNLFVTAGDAGMVSWNE